MSYQQQYRPPVSGFLPPAVKNLLIINVLLFVATYAVKYRFSIDMQETLGLHYPTSPEFRWYQLITHLFMHVNVEHIALNMIGLWMFGKELENLWGPKRFLIFYFITGLGAAFIQTLFNYWQIHTMEVFLANPNPNRDEFVSIVKHYWSKPEELMGPEQMWIQHFMDQVRDVPCMGASGALYGVLVGYAMFFPNTELIMIFFPVPIKAKYLVLIYAGIELTSGVSRMQGDNIAHFAHIGGALFGFILIKIWQRNRENFY